MRAAILSLFLFGTALTLALGPPAATAAPSPDPQLLRLVYRATGSRPADPADGLWSREIAAATRNSAGMLHPGLPINTLSFTDGSRRLVISIPQQGEPICDNGPNDASSTRDYALCPAKLGVIEQDRIVSARSLGNLCAESINDGGLTRGQPGWKDPAKWGTRGTYDPTTHTIRLVTLQNGEPARACTAILDAHIVSAARSTAPASEEAGSLIGERPLAIRHGLVPAGMVADDGSMTCYDYPGFRVKVLNPGPPNPDEWVALVPMPSGDTPRETFIVKALDCSTAPDPGQMIVEPRGNNFAGASGNFVIVEWGDSQSVTHFEIVDRRTGKPRYSDTVAVDTGDLGVYLLADEDDTLHVRYRRSIEGACSVPQGGRACMNRIAREGHLPAAVTIDEVAIQACIAVYRSSGATFDMVTAITYVADVLVPPSGPPRVLSRAAPSCLPVP